MTKLEKKVASVLPGEYTCQVRFKDGTIDAPSVVAQLPSGDTAQAPDGYRALAEKLSLQALDRKNAYRNRAPKGRVMSGRGVTS